jgi:hypothetical protein
MEKLIKEFERICDQGIYPWKMAKECTEVSKKIAIKYSDYIYDNFQSYDGLDLPVSQEELFDKFIEEEYGK